MNQKLRILIVEDNPADADFIHEMLPQAGPLNVQVESVQRLSEALARLKRGDIDLVLLDLGLPDSQGLQTFHTLQKAAPDIPVIVLTGNDDQELATAAMRDGAQDYLVKGQISSRPLHRAVRFALARRKANQALRDSEALLKETQKVAELGSYVLDIPGGIWQSSAVLDAVFGIDKTYESSMDGWMRLIHPDDRAMMADYFGREVLGRRQTFDKEYRIIRQNDRAERWVHGLGRLEFDDRGRPVKMIGTVQDITERKLAVEKLQLRESFLSAITENQPGLLWLKDAEGRFLTVNKAFAKACGRADPEQVRGLTDLDFWHKELAEKYRADDQRVMASGKACMVEEMIVVGNDRVWHETFKTPVRDDKGRVIGTTGYARDITERKRAEETLRESEERYHQLFDLAADPVILVDSETHRYVDVNQAAQQLYGYSREEFLRMGPEDVSTEPEKTRDEITIGSAYVPFRWHRKKNGEQFAVEIKASQIVHQGRKTALVILRDITERRRTDEALRQSQEKFKDLFDNSPIGFHEVDARGRIIRINNIELKMLGYAAEELLGQFVWKLSADEDESRRTVLAKLAGNMPPSDGFERIFRRKDGSPFPVLIIDRLLKREDGTIEGLHGAIQDITGRKRAEEAVHESQAFYHSLVEQLPAGVFRKNQDGRYVFVSSGFCRLKNMKVEDFLGKTAQEVAVSPAAQRDTAGQAVKYAAAGENHHQMIMRTGEPVDLVEEYEAADGQKLFVHAIKIPVFGPDGKIIGTQGILFDVTQQRKAEAELNRERVLWQMLMKNSPDHIYFKDIQSRFIKSSKAMGVASPDELVGKTDFDFFDEAHARPAFEDEQEIIRTGRPIIAKEEPEVWKNGRVTWASSTKLPLHDDTGKVVGIIGISRDITERKQAEIFKEIGREILQIFNEPGTMQEVVRRVIDRLKTRIGFDAVGLRLQDGEDFPYFIQQGFSEDFLATENSLAARTADGGLCRNKDGSICLECTCGLVISGKTDIANKFFTPGGSCWTNDSFPLPDFPASEDTQMHPRNACVHHGYDSVALLPIRDKARIIGLLQLNDRRKGRFTLAMVELLEGIALQIGEALIRKRTETDLKRERDLWRSLLGNTPDKIYFKDTQSRFVNCSQAMAAQFGVKSPDELVGKTDFDFFGEAHARPAFEDEQEIIRTGRPMIDKDEREESKDGRVTWVTSTKLPWLDGSGKIIGTMGISRDITGRKLAEERLRQLSSAVEHSPASIVIADPAGNIEYVNPKFTAVTGYSPEEAIGKNPRILKSGEMPAAEYRRMWQTITSGQEWRGEFHNRKKNGELFWESVSISSISDESGKIVHFMAVKEDITEFKQAREKLMEAFNFNQTIISNAAVGIVVFKASGPCVMANETAAQALKATVPQLMEQDFRKIVSWRASGVLKIAEEVLVAKEPRQCEASFVSTFGREVSLVCHFSPFVQNGEPHLLLVFTDVTEKKLLEAQFLRAQRMESIGTLAGGIAHDLNNVLAPLLISIQLLKDQITDPSGLELLETLETNVNRGTGLVRQVLAFGRGIKGERILAQVQHIAREISQIIQETFPKSLRFQLELAPGLWPVSCDTNQIHQVLLNLCVNARDAMPSGGKLSLRMENIQINQDYAARNLDARTGPHVVISVEDTGTGIPKEHLERIFEPFFTTKEVGKGTGLGLSTTMAIVKSHDGFIHCYSEPGKGTVFKVYLPADTTSVAAEAGQAKNRRLPRGNNELVLVVDDEEPIRSLAQQILKRFGYRVLLAADGAEAVALYNKSRWREIAVVITDMAMPVMDGTTTIAALRTINPKIKIIGSSGLGSEARKTSQSDTDIGHFLPKPYSAEDLLQMLHEVLQEDTVGYSPAKQDDESAAGK